MLISVVNTNHPIETWKPLATAPGNDSTQERNKRDALISFSRKNANSQPTPGTTEKANKAIPRPKIKPEVSINPVFANRK